VLDSIAQFWWSWVWPNFWQVALLAALIAVVDRLVLRRFNHPHLRLGLWSLVLLRLLLPPSLQSPLSVTALAFDGAATPNIVHTTARWFDQHTAVPLVTADALRAADQAAAGPAGGGLWLNALLLMWVVGVTLGMTVLINRALATRRFIRRELASTDVPDRIAALVTDLAGQLKLRRQPRIIITHQVHAPAICCAVRPIVLIPASMAERFSDADLKPLLRHELHHIRRGDVAFRWLVMTLRVLFWYHPAVHVAGRHISSLQELCCDAVTVRSSDDGGRHYYDMLLRVAAQVHGVSHAPQPSCSVLGADDHIVERLQRLRKTVSTRHGPPGGYGPVVAALMILLKVFIFPMG